MTNEEKLYNRVLNAFVAAKIPKPTHTALSLMAQIKKKGMPRESAVYQLLKHNKVSSIVCGFATWSKDTIEKHEFWADIWFTLVHKKL